MDYTEKNRIEYGKMEQHIPGKHSLWTRSIVYARGMQLQAVSDGAVGKILIERRR